MEGETVLDKTEHSAHGGKKWPHLHNGDNTIAFAVQPIDFRLVGDGDRFNILSDHGDAF